MEVTQAITTSARITHVANRDNCIVVGMRPHVFLVLAHHEHSATFGNQREGNSKAVRRSQIPKC
jgi:hypothetical protein